MVREIMGEKTGNVNASEIAASWKKVAEHLRKRANFFGKFNTWSLKCQNFGQNRIIWLKSQPDSI